MLWNTGDASCHSQSQVVLSSDFLKEGPPSQPQATRAELWGVLQSGDDWLAGFPKQASPGASEDCSERNELSSEEGEDGAGDAFPPLVEEEADGSFGMSLEKFWHEHDDHSLQEGVPLGQKELGQVSVRQVAVGSSHCIFVTECGQAFSYGCNERGQLGQGDFDVHDHSEEVKRISHLKQRSGESGQVNFRLSGADELIVLAAACGSAHSLLLAKPRNAGGGPSVFAFGAWEALGMEAWEDGPCDQHTPLALPLNGDVTAIAAHGGGSCCAASSSSRRLNQQSLSHTIYLWGEVDSCMCMCPNILSVPTPCFRIPDAVQAVSLGSAFGLALDAGGSVFAWGDGTYGELGDASAEESFAQALPTASSLDFHRSFSPTELRVPGRVPLPKAEPSEADLTGSPTSPNSEGGPLVVKRIVDIACGDRHSLLLDEDGRVYAFGENLAGQCGVPEAVGSGHITGSIVPRPRLVPMESERGARVFAGRWHSAVITREHRLYVWGHPGNRKLGYAGFNNDGTEAGEDPGLQGATAQPSKARPPGVAVRSALRDAVRRPRLVFALLHRRVRVLGMGEECTIIVHGDGGRHDLGDDVAIQGIKLPVVTGSDGGGAAVDLDALEAGMARRPVAPVAGGGYSEGVDAPVPAEAAAGDEKTRFSL